MVAHSAVNYAADGSDDFWGDLNFSDYNTVYYAMFPSCDLNTSADYIDRQLAHITAQASRDGLPWQIAELSVEEQLFSICDGFDFSTNEAAIYNLVFSKLNAAIPAYSGIQIVESNIETEAARNIVINYLKSRM